MKKKGTTDLPWGDQDVRVASFDLQDTKVLTQADFDALPVRDLKDAEALCTGVVPVGAAWKVHIPDPTEGQGPLRSSDEPCAGVWMYCEKVSEDGFAARWIRIGAVQ